MFIFSSIKIATISVSQAVTNASWLWQRARNEDRIFSTKAEVASTGSQYSEAVAKKAEGNMFLSQTAFAVPIMKVGV